MLIATKCGRLWRDVILCIGFLAGILSTAIDAQGVILYSTPDRNTTPPSVAEGLDAWNLQALWGSYLATPIDATHFIAARHIRMSTTIVFQNQTYPVDMSYAEADLGSDLAIFKLKSGSFSTYAPLYNAAVDGPEIGKTMTIIGRGTQRGNAVYDDNNALRGWEWGTNDGVKSWGQNVVSGFADYDPTSPDSLLSFNFDSNGIANESGLSIGDSSGGAFIFVNNQWKLAGINYSVDSPYNTTGLSTDPGFIANLFDARNYYVQDLYGKWVLVPDGNDIAPGASYSSRISDRLDWIESVVPGIIVPEPGTLALLSSGGVLLLVLGWWGRKRSTA
jgi:hypothetical protein